MHRPAALSLVVLFVSCAHARVSSDARPLEAPPELVGQAEISRYALTQTRYGEPREGDAIFVFVTEDFLPETQVKYEGGARDETPVKVVKLNAIRRFRTGIYDYSLMRSVFSPLVAPTARGSALKVTASVQDWCGQTWLQVNRRGGALEVTGHSYFEREGEEAYRIDEALLEDELWTIARLDPTTLPTGELKVVPSVFSARLEHEKPAVAGATGAIDETDDGLLHYRLAYAGGRRLELTIRRDAPHRIERFEEFEGTVSTARGERTHTVVTEYWNQHGRAFDDWRAKLGLAD